jgi:pyruvate/2-oxoglutarate/acetoin dehydrogenase E1 component
VLCDYIAITCPVQVPVGDYSVPLGVGRLVQEGSDVTLVGWGGQMLVLAKAVEMAKAEGISCDLIDLRTLLPWDVDMVAKSVVKTGKLIVSHEAPVRDVYHRLIFSGVSAEHYVSYHVNRLLADLLARSLQLSSRNASCHWRRQYKEYVVMILLSP